MPLLFIYQFNFKKKQLSNIESTILLVYDVIQLSILIYLTGVVTNPFIIFVIVPAIISSTLLNLTSTYFLTTITIISLTLLTFNYLPLPHPGDLHFHVPSYYIYAIPISLIIVLFRHHFLILYLLMKEQFLKGDLHLIMQKAVSIS